MSISGNKKSEGVKILSERIEEISTLIAEVANGNFDYKIDFSETGDELDAVISGVNMLGQELKNSTVSRDFMRSIYRGVVDMLLVLDNQFNVRIVNDALEEQLGWKEDELRGKSFFELILQRDEAQLAEGIAKLKKQGKCLNVELQINTLQGGSIPVSCAFSYLKNSRHEKEGILVIARDISKLKAAAQELEEAKNRAEAANEAKSQFLSSMSHEIRTPLNGILGFADLLNDTPLNDLQKRYLELIKTSGVTLTKLLNDILDLHRIEQNKLSFDPAPFHFVETITSHLSPYQHLAEGKGLSFTNTFDDSVPQLMVGDAVRINQVMVNLVSNAIKFTHEGSIKVHHKADPVSDGEEVVLTTTVADTGIGISPEKQEMIFDSFTQSDNSTTRKYGGWGLGLTISKKLIELMQGQLGVISPAPGKKSGSTFWFSLKLKVVKNENDENRAASYYANYRVPEGAHILVVEDNDMNMVLMQDILENMGALVSTARDGKEALDIIQVTKLDLVFMDLQMPRMGGVEATSRLRNEGNTVPVIAFSANAYQQDIHESTEAGMNGYLCKPFTRKELVEVLEKWL